MIKTFKTVAEFKRILAVGDSLHTTFHLNVTGRDGKGLPIYEDKDLGVRKVTVKQSNSFALATTKDNGEIADSWCEYPKSTMSKIEDNVLTIFTKDTRGLSGYLAPGQSAYDNAPNIPILTYKFV